MDKEILTLNELSIKLFVSDISSAIKEAEKAVELSKQRNLDLELAKSLTTLSQVLAEQGNFIVILKHMLEAISIFKNLDKKYLLAKAYSQLGFIYLINGDLDRAFSSFMSSIELYNEIGKEDADPKTILGLGTVLSFKESHTDAIKYMNQALEIARVTGNLDVELKSLNNLGCEYNVVNELDKAEEFLHACLDRCERDNLFHLMVPTLDELGVLYKKRGDDIRAVESWEKAIDLDSSRGLTFSSIEPMVNLSRHYIGLELWDKAKSCLVKATSLCPNKKSNIHLLEIYKLETLLSEQSGDYKRALEFHKKYFEIYQSKSSIESIEALKETEVEAITAAKDRIISLSNVGKAITESLDLKTILKRINSYLAELFEFSILGLARYEEDKKRISYDMFVEEGIPVTNFYISVDDTRSLGSWCIRNNDRVVISNIDKQWHKYVDSIEKPLFYTADEKKNSKSIIYTPLRVGDKIIGLLTIQSYNINAYSRDDIAIFDILSSYVAIGFNNALHSKKIEDYNKELFILAELDDLTGLKCRRAFFQSIDNFWSWSTRSKTIVSAIIMDIDFFKNINDSFGHPAGDYCLVEIGKILRSSIKRDNDVVARIGGEEFGLFLGDTDEPGAIGVAERIRESIDNFDFIFNGQVMPVTASFGISTAKPWLDITINDIMLEADKALYSAKGSGRNCVKSYNK